MKERRAWARQGKWGNLPFPGHLLCILLQFCCGCCLVTKSCPTLLRPNGLQPSRPLCPWDFPARILGQVAISFSGGPSQPNDRTCISCIGRWILLPLSHRGSPKIYYLCLNAQIPALRVQCFKTMAQLEENTVT